MDRKVLHLQTTTVNFRPKPVRRSRGAFSPRQERMTGSPDQSLYRCEVYGDRNKMGCYFLPSARVQQGTYGTKNRHTRIPNQKTYWLHEDDVLSAARPIYRIQSAPLKFSRLTKSGSRRSRGSATANGRPQTVAPCVRQLTETSVTNYNWESDGDVVSDGRSPVDVTSDKHGLISPDGDKQPGHVTDDLNLVMEPDYYTDGNSEGDGLSLGKDGVKNENGINRIKTPVKVTFESVDWIKIIEEYDVEDKYPIVNVNDQTDDSDDTKTDSLFDGNLLSNAESINNNSEQTQTTENEHEALLERIRQSYGVYDAGNEAPDKETRLHWRTLNSTGRQATMENDGITSHEKPVRLIRSTIQRAPLSGAWAGHGTLVKHLKEQRRKTPNKRKVMMETEVQLTYGIIETPPPMRNVSGLFLRTSTFVWYVCRLLGAMIDLSAEMTTRSATEGQWHALNTSREARAMAFNKAAFAKRKNATRVPLWAKRIMRKEPDDRTEQEVKRVHALLRGMKSFDRFTEKIQLSMCKSFVYYKITSGRVILRQGHVGQNFYFLFTGSVFVNIDDVDAKGNKFSKTEAILARGDSFGELALLQDIRRTATITCREDCEMLVVDKDTFARICPRIFELELEEKMAFVSKMKLFNLRIWDEDSLRKMCFEAQIQEYKTNKVVVVDSEKDDWIYICMEGKCQVIRRLHLLEEIAWRKLNQQKHSGPHRRSSRQDFLTVMTGMSNLSLGSKQNTGRRRSVTPAVKQNLLESMGLEYTQKRRLQHMRDRRLSSYDDLSTSLHGRGDYGPLTLTSLLANDERANGNHLYLNIHTMQQYDVFDLPSVLQSQEEMDTTTGSHLLVSLGSRLLRIKRSSYFKYATPDAIELARGLGLKYMYPSDDVLLQRYRDFLQWEVYKYQVMQIALTQKGKSPDVHESTNRGPGTPAATRNTAKELFELNKSTLTELNGILCTEEEPNNDEHWKQIEELKFSNCREWQKRQNEHASKKLPSLNQAQPNEKLKVTKDLNHDKSPDSTPKVTADSTNRRVSRVTFTTEFNTIVEMDEKDMNIGE